MLKLDNFVIHFKEFSHIKPKQLQYEAKNYQMSLLELHARLKYLTFDMFLHT
jgi:hypothetical protein